MGGGLTDLRVTLNSRASNRVLRKIGWEYLQQGSQGLPRTARKPEPARPEPPASRLTSPRPYPGALCPERFQDESPERTIATKGPIKRTLVCSSTSRLPFSHLSNSA